MTSLFGDEYLSVYPFVPKLRSQVLVFLFLTSQCSTLNLPWSDQSNSATHDKHTELQI